MGMTITEYMKKKYDNREDKDNIFGVGITDAEFRRFSIEYLLGEVKTALKFVLICI